ncbi:MAG: hypothetical protein WC924_05080 [Candidatus Gracilibacteria bacterium]
MTPITQTCRVSGKSFLTTDEDQDFYKKIGVPVPTLCPEERQRRRLSFRNERNLYHRKCDLTGHQIISNYSPDKVFKIYEKEAWWSDEWDPLSYGKPYDFSKPFFEQFRELQLLVPRINLLSKGGENVAYTNHATYNKNCYLLFNATHCEDVHYSTNYVLNCKKCIDCYSIDRCELLYNSIFCEQCYHSTDLVNCKNSLDSAFLYDCRNCQNCFMSHGLRNKKFCIENKEYSAEEYQKLMKKYDLGSYKIYRDLKENFRTMVRDSAVHRFAIIDLSEDCNGDYVFESKDTHESFYAIKCRDSKFIYDGYENIDCYDVYESAFQCERQYECYACNYNKFSYGSHVSHESSNLYYCDYCFNSNDLFGCISLKRKSFCILNKQYSQAEYEELLPRIIDHMKSTREWGEFLPSNYSPFAYNESAAQDFLPLSKEEVLKRGLIWKEKIGEGEAYEGPSILIPDHIRDVEPGICDAILKCEITGKYFKIIPQELEFYKQLGVALPRRCFEQRHKERIYFRNPRTLWKRTCMACKAPIESSYSPDRPEKVYCEACYLKTVY